MPTHVTFVVCRPLPRKDTAEPQLTGVCNEYIIMMGINWSVSDGYHYVDVLEQIDVVLHM